MQTTQSSSIREYQISHDWIHHQPVFQKLVSLKVSSIIFRSSLTFPKVYSLKQNPEHALQRKRLKVREIPYLDPSLVRSHAPLWVWVLRSPIFLSLVQNRLTPDPESEEFVFLYVHFQL